MVPSDVALEDDYTAARDEWASSGEEANWAWTVGDGIVSGTGSDAIS
jgi:hypothetical protein